MNTTGALQWRVIPLETHNAFMNMALDEACCDAIARGASLPTIRFYRWQPSAVSIGYFQSLEDEIAVDACRAAGVDIVRRRTGGGAVYHDYEGEITYSVMVPERDFCGSGGATGDSSCGGAARPLGITESYHVICGWIIDGLRTIGIEAEFKPINDIVVPVARVGGAGGADGAAMMKKISGNAQTRRNGVILQHGTILYTVDVRKMFSLLKVGKEKIADKLIASVEERVTSVRDVLRDVRPEVTREALYEALLGGFTRGKSVMFGAWSDDELNSARRLAAERYESEGWNKMR